ncbi:MAG: lytic murein transglycosylase B [Pseudomonadales bacterium]|nr:lytic murein transglycosylase B [Pseudomonadales bacterium]
MIKRTMRQVADMCITLLIITVVPVSCAEPVTYATHPEASVFIDEMVKQHGFDRKSLQAIFNEAVFKEKIIKLMEAPAEAKPWKDYRPILVTEQRTKQGLEFMQEHSVALNRAESIYGVPAEIIVAIIGVETRYGRVTGSNRVIDALTTLAFDYPRRAEYFRKELKEFLMLARDEKVDPLSLKGSYAGAMGYGQFMPSSFRAYAVDFDGDGHKDIWNNPVDAIGSVANYFHEHGWQKNEPVTERALVDGKEYEPLLVKKRSDLTPTRSVAELIAAGFKPQQALAPEQPATAMRFAGAAGDEHWIGLNNFYVITRYNHSALYAMAVYQLSQEIAGRT